MSEAKTLNDLLKSLPTVTNPSSQKILLTDAQGALMAATFRSDHQFRMNFPAADAGKWVRLCRLASSTSNIFHLAIEHGAGSGSACCLSFVAVHISTSSPRIRQLVPSPPLVHVIPKVRMVKDGADIYFDVFAATYGEMRVDFFGMTANVNTDVKGMAPENVSGTVYEFSTTDISS